VRIRKSNNGSTAGRNLFFVLDHTAWACAHHRADLRWIQFENRFPCHVRVFLQLFLLSCILLNPVFAGKTPKLLILGIDGCRPDALMQAQAPNLRALAAAGTCCWYALSRPPTKSGPCWSSIFTGVWNIKHGVTDNNFMNSNFGQYPHFFQRIKETNPALTAASIVYWPGINSGIPNNADLQWNAGSDQQGADKVIDLLTHDDFDVIFIQLGEIDAAGHQSGFSPGSTPYIDKIEASDGLVGKILTALRNRPAYSQEDWMIIAVSDHGGKDLHHGGSSIEEMHVFVIVGGQNIPVKEISREWQITARTVPRYGLKLNGTDEYISIADKPLFRFGSAQDFSIEFCIKTPGWAGTPVLIGNKNWQSKNSRGFAIVQNDLGLWLVNIADGVHEKDISGALINDDQWHHLTVTFRRAGRMTLYQDGIQIGAVNIESIGDISTSFGLGIGQDGTLSCGTCAKGSISEVRLWNEVLEDSTIAQWIFTPITANHPNRSSLIGYWKMDDAGNDTVTDHSLHGNNGLLHSAHSVWINPEEQVQILSFESCRVPKTADVAATGLCHLGIPIQPGWNLDGLVIARSPIQSRIPHNPSRPDCYELYQNFPNPFNPFTVISYHLSEPCPVTLKVYDVLGKEMMTLVDEKKPAGTHRINFKAAELGSGVYFYRLKAGHFMGKKKMVLIK
jgi:hypothetical protein